jgi:anti-anti-sigma regulatory factor
VRVNDADDPKGPVFRNRERFPDGALVPGVLIYRQDAPLFYANSDAFKDAVRGLADAEEARVVLLHGGAMPHVDSTGVAALEQLRRWLASRNKRLAMCEFNGPTRDALERAGLTYRADESVKEGGGFVEDDSRAEDELERPDSRDPATAAAPMYLALADAVRSAETTAARLAADEVCVGFDDDTHDQAARALVGGGGGDSVARRASRDSVGSAGSGGAYDDLEEGGKTAVSVPDY